MANRLFINFFQPSFKLLETQRIGGKTVRRHNAPKTPYNRLIELHTLRVELRSHFDDIIHALDPLKLLEAIRLYQHQLARIVVWDPVEDKNSDLTTFLQGLSVAWQEGIVNPLHHPAPSKPGHWRKTRADPVADVWNEIEYWLKDEPQLVVPNYFLGLKTCIRGNLLRAIAEHCNAGYRNSGSRWSDNWCTELVLAVTF